MSVYWISYHWLLSSLLFGSGHSPSASHRIHALHSWKLGQPKFPDHFLAPHRAIVQTHFDNAYLSALIHFSLCEQDAMSIPMAKLSFVTSALLISRMAQSNKLPWLAGVQVFRAGLLCLRSSSILEFAIDRAMIGHHVDRSIKLCTQLLGRICANFTGLSVHNSVCESLADLRRSVQHPTVVARPESAQELIGRLPSSLSRDMAIRTLFAFGTTSLECPTRDQMVMLRVSRFMNGLKDTSDGDKALYGLVFGFSE
jgi:hypothetical protein